MIYCGGHIDLHCFYATTALESRYQLKCEVKVTDFLFLH